MTRDHLALISTELDIAPRQAAAVAELLDDGATVPFISRYRKEATGSLDEVAITAIRDRLEQLEALDKRREAIFKSLTERELLTPELKRGHRRRRRPWPPSRTSTCPTGPSAAPAPPSPGKRAWSPWRCGCWKRRQSRQSATSEEPVADAGGRIRRSGKGSRRRRGGPGRRARHHRRD